MIKFLLNRFENIYIKQSTARNIRMSKQKFLSSSFKYRQQDPSFMGQELDQQLKYGPVQNRKCTDILCCLLFVALIAAMVYVGILGFKTGDPMLLASPFDQEGKQCGRDKGYQEYQKIFISFMNDDPKDVGFVCVRNCPKKDQQILDCIPNKFVQTCDSLKIYQSETVVNLCYPSQQIIRQEFDFDHFMDVSTLQEYFSDLEFGWPLIAGTVGVAFIISMTFTVFISYCAGCFVWTVIIFSWIFLACLGTSAFFINRVQFIQKIFNYQNLPQNLKDRDYQLACAYICWGICVIGLLVICCTLRQIRISIGIMKAAADFTRQQCSAFLIPIYITILQVVFLAIWITTVLYVFSSGEAKIQPIDNTPFGWVQWNTTIQWYTVLFVFGLLWVMFFFEGLGNFWTCSTVAIWYFQEGDPSHPILKSICRSFKAFGSIAFGSLLIAIVVFIRIVLEFITRQLKQQSLGMNEQNAAMQYLLKCASCCIACFERVIRFLTENAYIMMAISGKNFCQSAKQAFYLVLRSTTQFAISHGTTKIFITIGKILIIAICCLIGYLAITEVSDFKNKIYSPVFLTILFGIASYPIASAFLTLFQMAANTILMCYCMQLDLVKNGNPKCPAGLQNFLRNYMSQSVSSQND